MHALQLAGSNNRAGFRGRETHRLRMMNSFDTVFLADEAIFWNQQCAGTK